MTSGTRGHCQSIGMTSGASDGTEEDQAEEDRVEMHCSE
jgi:hypothetical protein